MFSEEYFVSRNRLNKVVKKIHAFAHEGDLDASSIKKTKEARELLAKPLRLLVLGEPKSGKSSLLAALFGSRLMMPENLAGSFGLDLYQLAEVKKDHAPQNGVRVLKRPLIDLKYVELIDTRGKPFDPRKRDGPNWEYIDSADFIIAVFSAQNPWCAWTWDVLSAMGVEVLNRTMIVIQQIDLLDKRDLRVVTDHMWSLVEQKLPQPVPLFPVSADRGMAARSSKAHSKYVWASTGCGPLEKELERRVLDVESKTCLVPHLRYQAEQLLEEIEGILGDRQRAIARQEVMLGRLEEEADAFGSEEISSLARRFDLLGDVFQGLGDQALLTLRQRLGFFSSVTSLFKSEALPADIEHSLVDSFGEAINERAHSDAKEMVARCQQHWESKAEIFRNEFDLEPQEFSSLKESFEKGERRFADILEQKTRHTVVNLRLRSKLDRFVGERQSRLRIYVASIMLLVAIAGFVGGSGLTANFVPIAILCLAAFICVLAIIYIKRSASEVIELFSEQLSDSQRAFISALGDVYRGRMRDVFLEYGALFDEPRHTIQESRQGLVPLQSKWNELYLELKATEQELVGYEDGVSWR